MSKRMRSVFGTNTHACAIHTITTPCSDFPNTHALPNVHNTMHTQRTATMSAAQQMTDHVSRTPHPHTTRMQCIANERRMKSQRRTLAKYTHEQTEEMREAEEKEFSGDAAAAVNECAAPLSKRVNGIRRFNRLPKTAK